MPLAKRAKQKEKWLRVKLKQQSDTLKLISKFRPDITFTRKSRVNKSEVYRRASEVCHRYRISGNYCGLAAAYAPEIYETFYPAVKSKFINCERDRSFAEQLKSYSSVLSWLYGKEFLVFEGNIFDLLGMPAKRKYSVIDLDLMNCLATTTKGPEEEVEKIVGSLQNTTNKFLLMIWSTYGMKVITEERYDTEVRDVLLRKLKEKHKVLQYLPFKYCDNHIPIKCEVLALQRRKK